MDIVIIWYWKMWKAIEQICFDRNHEILWKIDIKWWTSSSIQYLNKLSFDVIIDFTTPTIVMENIRFYAKNNIKAIIGTTWWYEQINEVRELYKKSSGAILWASNFSIWINLFWKIIKNSCQIIDKFEDYDIFWHEFHHREKVDSPSGTAITTANIIIDNIGRKKKLITEKLDRKPEKDELHFSSTRWGSIPWTHSVFFDSIADSIEIKHTARSRQWFALWAVMWAEWLKDKKWYFEVWDWINDISINKW